MFFSMFVGASIAAGAIGVSEEFATLHANCGPLGCSFAVSSSTAQFIDRNGEGYVQRLKLSAPFLDVDYLFFGFFYGAQDAVRKGSDGRP